MVKKKKKKNILKNNALKFKGIFIAIIIFTGLFIVSLIKETYRTYKINKEIKNLKSEINLLKNENTELASLINYLKTDNFVEKAARIKLGMKEPQEKVFIVEKNKSIRKNKSYLKDNLEEDNAHSNAEKWWQYFFYTN